MELIAMLAFCFTRSWSFLESTKFPHASRAFVRYNVVGTSRPSRVMRIPRSSIMFSDRRSLIISQVRRCSNLVRSSWAMCSIFFSRKCLAKSESSIEPPSGHMISAKEISLAGGKNSDAGTGVAPPRELIWSNETLPIAGPVEIMNEFDPAVIDEFGNRRFDRVLIQYIAELGFELTNGGEILRNKRVDNTLSGGGGFFALLDDAVSPRLRRT